MTREDPSFIILLLLTAHPNLVLDYEAMADASYTVPDPRMWTTAMNIRHRLRPLESMAEMLRRSPSAIDDVYPIITTTLAPLIPDEIIEGDVLSESPNQGEFDQEMEARAAQVLNTAWENYLSTDYNDGTSLIAHPPDSPGQSSQQEVSAPSNATTTSNESESNPAVTAQLEADIERRADHVRRFEFNVDDNNGVWVEQSMRMHERIEREERLRAARRAARAHHAAASGSRNHLPPDESNAN